ncbi:heteromeric transposase endonuclease subunit TnsA [Clostridium botulinum]|uniref:heteromeric transposase endonuclease subunit TnsA n=1 Tax=Clostridium botulinum TaxID=1491 RepID=UPI00077438E6|nr:heteromeric transposase endonuclease subunit TnsA [Clostridium botulinum]AUN04855.1 heteromeric transposase endonuclease subunit TnsA [Clostridium botulinum]
MSKRKRDFDYIIAENRLKEGRGKGTGKEYKPWITVRDVPSKGICSEILGWKTNRIHHLLSKLEAKYFFSLEWSSIVIDIREQFPLIDKNGSCNETLRISENIGVKHPTIPATGVNNILTTDFVITLNIKNEIITVARTIKYEKDLSDLRTLEKFEIERLYWKKRKIDWKIITERDVNETLSYNVELIHNYLSLKGLNLPYAKVIFIEKILRYELSNNIIGFANLSQKVDELIGEKPGTSLAVIKYLIANKVWELDMNEKINTELPIKTIRFNELVDKEEIR